MDLIHNVVVIFHFYQKKIWHHRVYPDYLILYLVHILSFEIYSNYKFPLYMAIFLHLFIILIMAILNQLILFSFLVFS
jgi:hypothetical protein